MSTLDHQYKNPDPDIYTAHLENMFPSHEDPWVLCPTNEEIDWLAQSNIREAMVREGWNVQEPDRFAEVRGTITPGRGSPPMQHVPGVGEPPSPSLMGMHTREFATERGVPFEEEDHELDILEDDEFMSTLPFGQLHRGPINEGPKLPGMYDNDYGRHASLLTQPVPINAAEIGGQHHMEMPEGAIYYTGQRLGRTELDDNFDQYSWAPAQYVDEEYIRNKEADPDWSPAQSAFWTNYPEAWRS